jgi:transcription elongation factor Elf1
MKDLPKNRSHPTPEQLFGTGVFKSLAPSQQLIMTMLHLGLEPQPFLLGDQTDSIARARTALNEAYMVFASSPLYDSERPEVCNYCGGHEIEDELHACVAGRLFFRGSIDTTLEHRLSCSHSNTKNVNPETNNGWTRLCLDCGSAIAMRVKADLDNIDYTSDESMDTLERGLVYAEEFGIKAPFEGEDEPVEPTCGNCMYFTGLEPIGVCRRHSPKGGGLGLFPRTAIDSWCGEHKIND